MLQDFGLPTQAAARREKSSARDAAARTCVRLFTATPANQPATEIAQRIEGELLPKLSGLLAAQDRRGRRGRFARLGSLLHDEADA